VDRRASVSVEGIIRDIEAAALAATGAKQHAAAIRAYELLGKQLGMFRDKVDVDIEIRVIREDRRPANRMLPAPGVAASAPPLAAIEVIDATFTEHA
jgi:hypothetical protein